MRLVTLALVCLAVVPPAPSAPGRAPSVVARIALRGVEGRIDHLAVDVAGNRLFVAALGNNSVEVLDLASSRWVRRVPSFHEPQGVAWLRDRRQLVVANGRTGEAVFVDGDDFHLVRRVALGDDADNVRVEESANRVWVGYGAGGVAALDAASGAKVSDVALGGHPESFQLTGGGLLVVNVPSRHEALVVDRARGRVARAIGVHDAEANYPMAIDEAHRRLFIGCRRPAALLVFDLDTGARVAMVPIGGDTDDLFYDAARQRLYVVCGEGRVDVIRQETPDRYAAEAHVPTAPGTRTGLFVPALERLFVAVPHRGAQAAEVLVFAVGSAK
jgi:DNA-binding beta-propeller fold protein YncE